MSDLLRVEEIEKSFDGLKALDSFSCTVRQGEIVGLLGPNGAGKTTLFNIVTGLYLPDAGRVFFKGKSVETAPPYHRTRYGMAWTFQEIRLAPTLSVLDNVLASFRSQPGEKLLHLVFHPRLCAAQERSNRMTAMQLLEESGLLPEKDNSASDLSYGQQKMLSLVCLLASRPALALLDEPVAGIAPEWRSQIISKIKALPNQGCSVVVIEHDVDTLLQICDRLIFMDTGRSLCEGAPDVVLSDPRVIEAYLG